MWRFMIIAENEEEVEEQKIMGLKECPECKERTLQMAGGCMQCSNCGYSKCD
jgi:ribosomal protein L37AE/L43A